MRAFYARLLAYVFVVAYLTSALTHATTYLRPDRAFGFDMVLYVVLLGAAATALLALIEFGVSGANDAPPPRRGAFVLLPAAALLWMNATVRSFTAAPTLAEAESCGHTYARVIHSNDDVHIAQIRRDFGGEFEVFRALNHSGPLANLTRERGIVNEFPEHHRFFLQNLVSTYDLLRRYHRRSGADWVVVLEDGAQSLPDFDARVRAATCGYPEADVFWLQGQAILRWTLTGGLVDETAGLVYKRSAIPKILAWMDLDGAAIDYARREHDGSDGEGGWQRVALFHVISDGCWKKELRCDVVPALVTREKRKR